MHKLYVLTKKAIAFIIGFALSFVAVLLIMFAISFALEYFFDFRVYAKLGARLSLLIPIIVGIISVKKSNIIFDNIANILKKTYRFALELPSNAHRIKKDTRVLIFTIFVWNVCVVTYVFLGEPYGWRISGKELWHMLTVMVTPSLICALFFWVYKVFVK